MSYDPEIHHRKSIRLKEYDYSQAGGYFITICTNNKKCTLGNIVNEKVELSDIGKIANDFWFEIPKRFNIELDGFVVMPNHVHGIVMFNCRGGVSPPWHNGANAAKGGETPPLRNPTLGQIIGYYKYQTTKLINQTQNTPSAPVWQRNYFEHVIRNEDDLYEIRNYIIHNPLKWDLDKENPFKKPIHTVGAGFPRPGTMG